MHTIPTYLMLQWYAECEGERNLKYYCSGNYVTPRLNINAMAAAALVGCRVERLKAKQPNLLQVSQALLDL